MWNWLLKVDPIARSLLVYAPLVSIDKAIIYGRVILLTWLLGAGQYGVWQLGVMVFSIVSAMSTLGANHGLARYVSQYQACGQLREFSRRAAWGSGMLAVLVGVAALLLSGPLTGALSLVSEASDLDPAQCRNIVLLALVNGLAMGLYINLQSYIRALRTFRLLAAMDLFYTLTFTALAVALARGTGSGTAVLAAHAATLGLMLVLGHRAAGRALDRLEYSGVAGGQAPPPEGKPLRPVLRRLLGYGMVAMSGALIWEFGSQVSAWFVKYHLGLEKLGVYGAFRQMSQLAWGMAGMAWGLLFSHVANLWERGRRAKALRVMNLSYKLVVLVMMTASMLVLATAPAWTLLLRASFRRDLSLLAGLLMFYQCSANLGMAGIVAQLRERPAVTVAIVSAGVLVNAALAWAWVPHWGLGGAAQAAGLAGLAATLMGVLYMLIMQPSLHLSGHLLALSPIIFLLPGPLAAGLWALVLVVAAATRLVFSRHEKILLRNYVLTLGRRLRSHPGDRPVRSTNP